MPDVTRLPMQHDRRYEVRWRTAESTLVPVQHADGSFEWVAGEMTGEPTKGGYAVFDRQLDEYCSSLYEAPRSAAGLAAKWERERGWSDDAKRKAVCG